MEAIVYSSSRSLFFYYNQNGYIKREKIFSSEVYFWQKTWMQCQYAELELRVMFLKERRKPMNFEKKPRKWRSIRQSTDTQRQVWESNPGHIGDTQTFSLSWRHTSSIWVENRLPKIEELTNGRDFGSK